MAVEITGWGCPSYIENQWVHNTAWRVLTFEGAPEAGRINTAGCPTTTVNGSHSHDQRWVDQQGSRWSAFNVRQAESALIRMVRCGHGVSNRGQQWKLGQRCWNRWSMDDLDQRGGELMISCGGGRGCWTKLTKYLGHLINSTECATRTADKDTAVLHSRRLNDSPLRGRWDLFSTKNVDFWDFNDNDIRDLDNRHYCIK